MTTTPADALLQHAAAVLALVSSTRADLRTQVDARDEHAQRAALSAAVHGLIPAADLASTPSEAITTAGRLLAWTVAARAVRSLSARTTPFAVRLALVQAPRLDLPLDVWAELCREAEDEIDAAEQIAPRADALAQLLGGLDVRSRRTLAALLPIADALDHGAPLLDTAARLRAAADLFEGSSTTRGRRAA